MQLKSRHHKGIIKVSLTLYLLSHVVNGMYSELDGSSAEEHRFGNLVSDKSYPRQHYVDYHHDDDSKYHHYGRSFRIPPVQNRVDEGETISERYIHISLV